MNNTKCRECEYDGFCNSRKRFKEMKKKCKKLKKKYKGIDIEISCGEYRNYLDNVLNDSNSFDDPFGCNTDCLFSGSNSFDSNFGGSFNGSNSFDDTDTDNAADNVEKSDNKDYLLDIHDNISKSLSEIELLNKNIESLINLLQNKLK